MIEKSGARLAMHDPTCNILTRREELIGNAVSVSGRPPSTQNLPHEHGPFDIIGDVHGCLAELTALLDRLGYRRSSPVPHPPTASETWHHRAGRKAIFLGDLVDRGPDVPGVLKLVIPMVQNHAALCVPGNHDMKLTRKLKGKDVKISHGLAESLRQLDAEPPPLAEDIVRFFESLPDHYVLDNGRLVVAHAGLKEEMHGQCSEKVRHFALHGEKTGEIDAFGQEVRVNWAAEYHGRALVVYGHTPLREPCWQNQSVNIDTGCVFGGKLTALRSPERETVSVPAARVYFPSKKPFLAVPRA
jgi:protein phosphatase